MSEESDQRSSKQTMQWTTDNVDQDEAILEEESFDPDEELPPPEDEPDWRDDVESAGGDEEKEATVSVRIESEI